MRVLGNGGGSTAETRPCDIAVLTVQFRVLYQLGRATSLNRRLSADQEVNGPYVQR